MEKQLNSMTETASAELADQKKAPKKSAPRKKAAKSAEKPEKWSESQYAAVLQEKKQTAHDKMWLYIDINAKDLMEEYEPGIKNLTSACKAMLASMLEGDGFIEEPKVKTRIAGKLTIRYYVDNLSPERRTWAEANA